jgi:hypothetical protein
MDENNAPKFKYFDLWNIQTQLIGEDEEGLPFPTPAAFIEFQDSHMQTLGNRKQQGNVAFIIHVVSEVYGEHSSREDEIVRTRSLEHLNLLDDVFIALQNYSSDYFGSINKTGFPLPDHNHDMLYEHGLPFETRITDSAAQRLYQKVENVQPEIKQV